MKCPLSDTNMDFEEEDKDTCYHWGIVVMLLRVEQKC